MEGFSPGGPPSLISPDFPPLTPSLISPTPLLPSSSGPLTTSVLSLLDSSNKSSETSVTDAQNSSLWSDLFSRASTTRKKFPPRTYTTDGVPMVKAPPTVLLKSSEAWKDHVIGHFFGDPPPIKKIYADLNRIWGKKGAIQVHYYTPRSCLFFIPNPSMRKWVLDVGFWSTGTVAFAVSPWTPSSSLSEQALISAPVWISLQGIPPQLWSQEGVELIASGVGDPLPLTSASKLPPFGLGAPRIRVVVPLDKGPLPSSVIVVDEEGSQVLIEVQFEKLPPLCPSCHQYGHRSHRCPQRSRAPPPAQASMESQPPASVTDANLSAAAAQAAAPTSPPTTEWISTAAAVNDSTVQNRETLTVKGDEKLGFLQPTINLDPGPQPSPRPIDLSPSRVQNGEINKASLGHPSNMLNLRPNRTRKLTSPSQVLKPKSHEPSSHIRPTSPPGPTSEALAGSPSQARSQPLSYSAELPDAPIKSPLIDAVDTQAPSSRLNDLPATSSPDSDKEAVDTVHPRCKSNTFDAPSALPPLSRSDVITATQIPSHHITISRDQPTLLKAQHSTKMDHPSIAEPINSPTQVSPQSSSTFTSLLWQIENSKVPTNLLLHDDPLLENYLAESI